MRFEWDDAKATLDLANHGVPFEYACHVFADVNRIERYQRRGSEDRWQIIGRIEDGVYIVITHERHLRDGEEVTRIISARRATGDERKHYFRNRSQF
ncbi:MAG: BrnT family toxin [Rhodospirillaceae bacterium]|jgi:uncharacterized protein|nr:BrnT family toxin [Rhodospirillaceae bacterium]MBT4487991.1 BrnT family toxin [Rhodospirillaceae bacterium]MBT5192886.1 BrnT family toxin [Rhodospirillaceae bacterium]MBT5894755.1 BrnT family toxin [Rhodospirillaceae bacterium]MBT6426331.1 BrnT family toxin [Rhodospirillaceae bacterium]